jgi:hypothetical protein
MTYIPENYKPIKLETNGTLNKYPLITLINPQTSQISSTNLNEYKNKKWISSCIFFNELDLSTIVFSDLYGIYGSFIIPSYLPKLTTISFPILNIINGSFVLSPNTGATNSVSQLPLLVNILLPNLTTIIGSFNPSNLASLTTLSFPVLDAIGGSFTPSNLIVLTSSSFPVLNSIGGSFNPNFLNTLTTFSFPVLNSIGGTFNPSSLNALTSLSFPVLDTIGGTFNPSSLNALTSLSFPVLDTIGGSFNPNFLNTLTTFSFPVLNSIGGSFTPNLTSLTSLTLPNIKIICKISTVNAIYITAPNLREFSFGTSLKQVGYITGDVTINCVLNSTSVDNILVSLANLDGTNDTTTFNNRTVNLKGANSSPTEIGNTAKTKLILRGCIVNTN